MPNEVYTDFERTIPELSPIQEIAELVDEYPNDQQLGEAVRNYIKNYNTKENE